MGNEHAYMAHRVAQLLLRQLRCGEGSAWAPGRLTTQTTMWHGIADWPRPDFTFEDVSQSSSLAGEFKPPGHGKREYVTGLGQSLTYLKDFEFSLLVVPKRSADGFHIARYLSELLTTPSFGSLPVGLMSYLADPGDPKDLRTELRIPQRSGTPPPIPKGIGRRVFWAYWRDLSQHDLLTLLKTMDREKVRSFDAAYKRFWTEKMAKGKARTWEGRFRKKKDQDAAGYDGERRNAHYSLRHIGLLDADDMMTGAAYDLLRIGKVYGAASTAFVTRLGRHVLLDGKHLDLVLWVAEKQREFDQSAKVSSRSFFEALDEALQVEGVIKQAPKGKAKATFLRDEQKLWNKLGLLVHSTAQSYFHEREGLRFDWKRIIEMAS